MILQKRLAEWIRNSSYSRAQIAELCGTTEVSLSRYVNGERMPKSEILANLATVFGTTTDYLLGNEMEGGSIRRCEPWWREAAAR